MIKFKDKSIENKFKENFEWVFSVVKKDKTLEESGVLLAQYTEKDSFLELCNKSCIDNSDENIIELSEDSLIRIEIPTPKMIATEMKLREIFEIISRIKEAKIVQNTIKINDEYWINITGVTETDTIILVDELKKEQETRLLQFKNSENKSIRISIVNGITDPTIYKIINGYNFDETQDEIYIKIKADILEEKALQYCEAYIYENSTCLKPISVCYCEEKSKYNSTEDVELPQLRQTLLTGKGLREVINIFNKATKSNDIDMQIIEYTKVLEYVGTTLEFEEKVNRVSVLLNRPDVLKPTADYIKKMIKAIGEVDENRKDKNLIKYVIDKTCIGEDILEYQFVTNSKNKEISSIIKNKTISKEELAKKVSSIIIDIISDTRNQLVHAKANYEKKGNECLQNEKVNFVQMLKKIADSAIRKYNLIHEDYRITNE